METDGSGCQMPNDEYKGQRRVTAWSTVSREFGGRCPRCSSVRTEERGRIKRRCLDCGNWFDKQHRNINIDDYNYRPDGSVRWLAEEKGLDGPMNSRIVREVAGRLGAYALEVRSTSGPWCSDADCPCALHWTSDTSIFRIRVVEPGKKVGDEMKFNREEMVEFADSFDSRFPRLS
jgi:hypothetical protein